MNKLSLVKETYDVLFAQSSISDRYYLFNEAMLLVALDATDQCDDWIEYWQEYKKTIGWLSLSGYSRKEFRPFGIVGMLKGIEPAEMM